MVLRIRTIKKSPGFKMRSIQPQINNNTWHITLCYLFNTHTKEPSLTAITWSNHFLYGFISLWMNFQKNKTKKKHKKNNLALVHWGLWASVSGFWTTLLRSCHRILIGLGFDWAIATPWFFSFSASLLWDLLVCLASLSRCKAQFWLWDRWTHLTLEYFGTERS